jgi:RHS repeat-associated protein
LSKFNYSYNAIGNITQWGLEGEAPAEPKSYGFTYDSLDQLTGATLTNTTNNTVIGQYVYRYDSMGNRTNESVSGTGVSPVFVSAGYNELNQLTTLLSSNPPPRHFRGTVSEDATVTINGQAATVSNKVFEANVSLQAGTNTVTIIANAEGRHQTNRYQVVEAGKTFTYDANGNLVSNGVTGARYEWDAANRLLAVQSGTGVSPVIRSEFTYDGYSRRVRQVEKVWSNSQWQVTSEKRLLWLGTDIAEERDTNNNVTKRYFARGVSVLRSPSSVFDPFFYTRDHLDSIRELTDTNGTVRARYAYDPWGRRTKLSGDLEADFGFTGHYFHAPSGLHLALYRAYDADLGRWISRDPIGEGGGLNLYGYVYENPINATDLLGLKDQPWPFQGCIDNDSKFPLPVVDSDNKKCEIVLPGKKATPNCDWDFVKLPDGTWWKIGPGELDIGPDGKPKWGQWIHDKADDNNAKACEELYQDYLKQIQKKKEKEKNDKEKQKGKKL